MVLALAGCSTITATPDVYPSDAKDAPTVTSLLDHVACELAVAMEKHADKDSTKPNADNLWNHLAGDNFVATVNLTLTVTDSEGFNPAFGVSQPLAFFGGSQLPYVSGVSNNYHRSASLGFQYTRLQDKNFIANYFIDMARLTDYDKDNHCLAAVEQAKKEVGYLSGTLKLEDTVANGLTSIDRTSQYSIFNAAGPKSDSDTKSDDTSKPATTTPPPSDTEKRHPNFLSSDTQPPTATFTQSPAAVATGGGAVASFTSKIDFSVVKTVNGGVEWTLLRETGPAAGSNPLLSYSTTALDSMTITMAPSCHNNGQVDEAFAVNVAPTGKDTNFSWIRPKPDPAEKKKVEEAKSADAAAAKSDASKKQKEPLLPTASQEIKSLTLGGTIPGSESVISSNGVVTMSGMDTAVGVVAWTGIVSGPDNKNMQTLHIVGVVKNAVNANTIGKIDLRGTGSGSNWTLKGKVSSSIDAEAFDDFARAETSWQTIPNCDAVAAGGLLNVPQQLTTQNVISRLPAMARGIFNQ